MLPIQRIQIKTTAKENAKFGLFNSASYAVVACTVPEIGALKEGHLFHSVNRRVRIRSCYCLLLQFTEDDVP